MLARIGNLVVKELIQLWRDRLMTALILLFPTVQLILLAQATGQGINQLPLAVLDQDRSPESRALSQALANVRELSWRHHPVEQDELERLIAEGEVAVAVIIPPGFGTALLDHPYLDPPELQVIVDGTNAVVGRNAKSAVEAVVGDYARRLALERGWPAEGPIGLRTAVRFNPALNGRLFTIPAQMGFIIYQVTLAVASLAFARERELGTLEQLLVMPLRRIELISGKALVAWFVGGLDFLLMYGIVVRIFAIPMRGNFSLLLALSLLFVAVEIGYGVMISSFARSQQQAILYVFVLAMLDVAFSGYMVPVKNMPPLFGSLAVLSPLQHYLVITRAIMLKGAGLAVLWPRVVALAAIGSVVGVLALRTSTRSLE